MNNDADRYTPHQYRPPSQEGELRFAWNGQEEYVRVYARDAPYPHAVINTTDVSAPATHGRACRIPYGDQRAFEEFCEEWMRHADPTELPRC